MNDLDTPQRILIIRLSALGDVVMASGLITALQARFPQAQLSWLCEPAAAPLLQHNPRLTKVLVWPRPLWRQMWREGRWHALWTALRAFQTQLRQERYDLVLDAQGLLKSGLCAWLTRAPRRVSLIAREGSRLLVHERVVPPPEGSAMISSEYRYLARYLGAQDADFRLDLAVGKEARRRAEHIMTDAGAAGPVVVLCPFTTRPQKHWFESYWVELAAALRRHGLTPMMLGGPADQVAAERIAQQGVPIVNLVGQLKLDESVAAIARSELLIGVDTGLTHMGTALGLPTVALFGSTRPYLQTGLPSTVVMYDALPCSPCRRHPTCNGRYDCMRQLTVSRVLDTALSLYQGRT